uniref:phospholipase A and acyltransferase 3-like n=1 Tax=Myxine glutinosa TaxID=7769 RepID=UPI00358F18F4
MEPGDVICVRYDGNLQFHFGVYVGVGHVVHLVAPTTFPCFLSCPSGCERYMSMSSCAICSGCPSSQGPIPAGCEICSGSPSSQRPIPAGFGRVQRNTIDSFCNCKTEEITVVPHLVFAPLPVEKILKRCNKRVDDLIKFDLVNYNGEHFANEMRYGQPVSHQVHVTCAAGGAVTGLFALIGGFTAGPVVLGVAAGSLATYYAGSAISSAWNNFMRTPIDQKMKQKRM